MKSSNNHIYDKFKFTIFSVGVMVKAPGSTVGPAHPHFIPAPVASHGELQGGGRGKALEWTFLPYIIITSVFCGGHFSVAVRLHFEDAVALQSRIPEASMWLI